MTIIFSIIISIIPISFRYLYLAFGFRTTPAFYERKGVVSAHEVIVRQIIQYLCPNYRIFGKMGSEMALQKALI